MRMLGDTDPVMKTGYLKYYLWVMSQCPGMVDGFLQCGKNITYDIVPLLVALDLKVILRSLYLYCVEI